MRIRLPRVSSRKPEMRAVEGGLSPLWARVIGELGLGESSGDHDLLPVGGHRGRPLEPLRRILPANQPPNSSIRLPPPGSVQARLHHYGRNGPRGSGHGWARTVGRVKTTEFEVDSKGRRVVDLTDRVRAFAAEAGGDGLVNVFLPHATAGLALMETGSGSERDLEEVLERLLPREDRYAHRHGRSGHGGDHLLPAFVTPSLVVPVEDGASPSGRGSRWSWSIRTETTTPRGAAELRAGLEVLAGRAVGALAGRRRRTAWTSRSRSRTSSSPVELDLEAGRRQEQHPVAVLGHPDVGTDERHVGPGETFRRRHRGGRDQQAARGLPLPVLRLLHDQPVAGEPDVSADRLRPVFFDADATASRLRRLRVFSGCRPGAWPECSERHSIGCPALKARKVLDDAVKDLKASPAIDHWQRGRERIEAEDLIWHVLGDEQDPDGRGVGRRSATVRGLVRRRVTGEPIPYIKGSTEFRGLDLLVRPGVFVPRDSSENLATQATGGSEARRRPVHVDLATGAGTIALAVANEVPGATVVGTDVSADAVALARKNAKRLGLERGS